MAFLKISHVRYWRKGTASGSEILSVGGLSQSLRMCFVSGSFLKGPVSDTLPDAGVQLGAVNSTAIGLSVCML